MESSTHGGDQSSVTSIVIPTCNRPIALERCLSTLLSNLSVYGHEPSVIVADGSTSLDSHCRNYEVIKAVNTKHTTLVTMIGPEERTRLTQLLVSAGLDEKVVSFGINGLVDLGIGCVGSNRNLLLLATVGEKFLSADDDTEFLFASADQFRSASASTSVRDLAHGCSIHYQVFQDRKDLRANVEFSQIDFVAAHEAILGLEVKDPVPNVNQAETFGARESHSPRNSGTVLLTLSGLIGDCGWGTPSRFLFISGSSLERLTKSDDIYVNATCKREMAQLTETVLLTRSPDDVMTTAFGADSRLAFPPFIPVGRGEDLLLAQFLKKTRTGAWFGHLPHAIFHAPPERRQFRRGEIVRSASGTDLNSLLGCMIGQLNLSTLDTFGSLRDLGRSLTELAMMPAKMFHNFIRRCRKTLTESKLKLLEDRLTPLNEHAPSYVSDVKKYMERLLDGDKSEAAGIPAELLYGREPALAIECTQEVVAMYGRLIWIWPDMIEATAKLKKNNQFL